jgi:hypothetical protein
MGVGNFIKNLVSGGAGELIDKVSSSVDKFVQTKDEKDKLNLEIKKLIMEHEEKTEAELTKRFEATMKDMADARSREVQIATSEKAPLLNKIVTPILAFAIVALCFVMWYILVFVDISKDKEMLVSGIVGSLTTIVMQVLSYYFGSSQSSQRKQDMLEKQMK